MPVQYSTCFERFGHEDFDPAHIASGLREHCPVRGCSASLLPATYGSKGRTIPWCPTHGIRLHSNTFVYWNGPSRDVEARLRNFTVRHDLVRRIALTSGMKAESHRLGYEMSEDALTWNVFVSVQQAGKLRDATAFLTGLSVRGEPELYLWGRRVDDPAGSHATFPDLVRVRGALESDIRTFVTEPDILLRVPGELLVCIEAKFGSANPLAHESVPKPGEKPTSKAGLLSRYLGDRTSNLTRQRVLRDRIGTAFRSQLFRNVVFASEMAGELPWHVVNLVSSTQAVGTSDDEKSYEDPTPEVRGYLADDVAGCFTFRTWEGLHDHVIANNRDLAGLDHYLRDKSAHFRPAFNLA
jgi:hypothetical protein